MPNKFHSRIAAVLRRQTSALLSRKVVAMDLGSSHIKVVFAEATGGQILFRHCRNIDLQAEGLISLEEINRHLREVLRDYDDYPVALAIPQHLSQSHLVELPEAGLREIKDLVFRETLNLSGLSEGVIVYDYHPLKPWGKHRNPYWVTISLEQEVNKQLDRLLVPEAERCFVEITSAANALLAAATAVLPKTRRLVAADLGTTSTVVAIMEDGQGVFATSFPIGGESFTNAVAALKKCPFEEAEGLKKTRDLFAGTDRLAGFYSVIDFWQHEFEKIIREWMEENLEVKQQAQPLTIVLSGGAANQSGLLPYLRSRSVFDYQLWPEEGSPADSSPAGCFAIVKGLAYQALGRVRRSCSLLTDPLRQVKRRQRHLMLANWIGTGLTFGLTLLLAAGLMHKAYLQHQKTYLLRDAEAALKRAQVIENLMNQKEWEYAKVLPVLERQKRTTDILRSLQILQQVRERRDLWFVLFADSQSYFSGGVGKTGDANTPPAQGAAGAANSLALPKGFIAELVIPDKGGDKFKQLSALVGELKKEPLFRNVDVLASNQRNTNFFDPKFVPPDRYFSLLLALAEPDIPRPLLRPMAKTNAPAATPRKPQ